MTPTTILLMMIVDTVAQVSAKGQWRPLFDISGHTASLAFRPADFNYNRPVGTWPRTTTLEARIVARDAEDAQAQLEQLQAMLALARRHLDTAQESAA